MFTNQELYINPAFDTKGNLYLLTGGTGDPDEYSKAIAQEFATLGIQDLQVSVQKINPALEIVIALSPQDAAILLGRWQRDRSSIRVLNDDEIRREFFKGGYMDRVSAFQHDTSTPDKRGRRF